MDKSTLISEWKKQIAESEKLIKRHKQNGFYDLAKKAEDMKKVAEQNLKRLEDRR